MQIQTYIFLGEHMIIFYTVFPIYKYESTVYCYTKNCIVVIDEFAIIGVGHWNESLSVCLVDFFLAPISRAQTQTAQKPVLFCYFTFNLVYNVVVVVCVCLCVFGRKVQGMCFHYYSRFHSLFAAVVICLIFVLLRFACLWHPHSRWAGAGKDSICRQISE